MFLAKHRFIQTQPLSYLKVYRFRRLHQYPTGEAVPAWREVFHGQDTPRASWKARTRICCKAGDMFAVESDDTFVEPTEYIEKGRRLATLLGDNPEWPLTWPEKIQIIKGGQRAGARPPARRHSPRRPADQHRRRPGRVGEAGEL